MADPLAVLAPPCVVDAASTAASAAVEPACHAVESIGEPQKSSGNSTVHERYAVEQYDQRNCPICLEGYTPENPAVVYGCGHAYHLQCAEGWRLQSGEDACCMCGADIHGNAATAEPVVLNSAATPGRSPAKSASPEAKAGGAGSSSSSPPLAAAAIASSTRAILPSMQSLDGLAHMTHAQAVCSHAHAHVAAADVALSQSQRRHRRAARSSANHDSPDGGAEDEAAPLTPGVEASPQRPRGNRSRRGTGGRTPATFSGSSSPSPAPGVRVARRGGPSPDRVTDSPTADPLLADDAFGAWATMRRLICCCFPGGGRRAEHVVQAVSIGAADEGRPRRAEPSRQRVYFTHSGSPRQRRAANLGSMPGDDDDDDGFVMVPTPSQSDAEDEATVTATEVRPPRHHRLARGWPE